MSKGSVSLIALAVMMVAIAVFVADPSRNGQQAFMALGFLASVIVVIGGLLGASSESGERNVHQETHIHNHPAPAAAPMVQPIQQPAAAPQIIYLQAPAPYYPPAPAYALPPQYAATAGHLAAQQAPAAIQYQPAPAIEHHQPQYRGALDVVAVPVHQPAPPRQVAPPAIQLEHQQSASFIRRVAKRAMSS